MKLSLFYTTALLASSAFAETEAEKKTGDLCAPPPGSVAPSLPAKLLEGQGTVRFKITTKSSEAQRFFEQGVAQMHSFWAREAERSFLQAAALDPEAPMPQWGIAMVANGDYRPRFQLDTQEEIFGKRRPAAKSRALDGARKALELSGPAGNATPVERMYIESVMAWRNPASRHPEDDFVQALRKLVSKYPDELEAKSYLALMIMRGFKLPHKKPRNATSMEAVQILRELVKQQPEHPGFHHYIIHGWEGSTFAAEAWPSCRRYAELTPNIPHALHMPGHIYSQTGKWKDAVDAFEAAAANERDYMKADSLYGSGHHGHNVNYLATSYSFAGDYEKAIASARELLAIRENPREAKQMDNFFTAYAQGWIALLRALVQWSRWEEILTQDLLPASTKPRFSAWRHWARGLALASKGDVRAAKMEALDFEKALIQLGQYTRRETPAPFEVARKELSGHIAIAEGKIERGLGILERASVQERGLRYSEPPSYPRPVAEALGSLAAQHGKTSIADKAFRIALEQYPDDYHAQKGLRALRFTTPERNAGL